MSTVVISNRQFDGIMIDRAIMEELRCTLALGRFWEDQGKHKEADEKFRELMAQVRLLRVMLKNTPFSDAGESELLEQLETEIDEHGVDWALTKPEHRS